MKIAPLNTNIFLLLAVMSSGMAAEFVINDRQDLPDLDPGDGVAITEAGTTTVRAAIEEANALPGEDTITCNGVIGGYPNYGILQVLSPLFVTDDLRVEPNCVILINLRIQGDVPFRAMEVGPGVSLYLRRIYIDQGFGGPQTAIANYGALMYLHAGSTVTLSSCRLQSGLALAGGGAVYVDHATLLLSGTTVSGTSEGDGGAIYNNGGTVVVSSYVSGEAAGRGGAIFNQGGVVSLVHRGGAIRYPDGIATLGGSIYSAGGMVTIDNSWFVDNSAEYGGAIYLDEGASLEMTGCSFRQNTAEMDGGAIYVKSGTVRASQCTFGTSTAGGAGGGIFLSDGSVSLLNCTVTANTAAGAGGGVYVAPAGTLSLGNTLIAENTATNGNDLSGAVQSMGHNLIGQLEGGTGYLETDLLGTSQSPLLPQLQFVNAPEGYPVAASNVYISLETSPVIDAGDTSLLFHEDFVGSACFDARLSCCPRVRGAAVDIGAIEVQQGDDSFACADGTHSADYNRDKRIGLNELLRVIQLYNSPGFHCDSAFEDGYAPGLDATAQDCAPHSADYAPQDWRITLNELLRLIQFFNAGGYYPCPDSASEDGFCVGQPVPEE